MRADAARETPKPGDPAFAAVVEPVVRGNALALAGAAAGWLIAVLSFRAGLKGSYFALVTLAFAEVFRVVALSVPFTGAGVGLMLPLREGAGEGLGVSLLHEGRGGLAGEGIGVELPPAGGGFEQGCAGRGHGGLRSGPLSSRAGLLHSQMASMDQDCRRTRTTMSGSPG